VSDKSVIETRNFFRSHAIKHDQQNKERSAKQMHNTYLSPDTGITKKNKFKTALALIHELQVQNSSDSDDELNSLTLSKSAIACKLVQVSPEIRIKGTQK
jgi:hypothetical protein